MNQICKSLDLYMFLSLWADALLDGWNPIIQNSPSAGGGYHRNIGSCVQASMPWQVLSSSLVYVRKTIRQLGHEPCYVKNRPDSHYLGILWISHSLAQTVVFMTLPFNVTSWSKWWRHESQKPWKATPERQGSPNGTDQLSMSEINV